MIFEVPFDQQFLFELLGLPSDSAIHGLPTIRPKGAQTDRYLITTPDISVFLRDLALDATHRGVPLSTLVTQYERTAFAQRLLAPFTATVNLKLPAPVADVSGQYVVRMRRHLAVDSPFGLPDSVTLTAQTLSEPSRSYRLAPLRTLRYAEATIRGALSKVESGQLHALLPDLFDWMRESGRKRLSAELPEVADWDDVFAATPVDEFVFGVGALEIDEIVHSRATVWLANSERLQLVPRDQAKRIARKQAQRGGPEAIEALSVSHALSLFDRAAGLLPRTVLSEAIVLEVARQHLGLGDAKPSSPNNEPTSNAKNQQKPGPSERERSHTVAPDSTSTESKTPVRSDSRSERWRQRCMEAFANPAGEIAASDARVDMRYLERRVRESGHEHVLMFREQDQVCDALRRIRERVSEGVDRDIDTISSPMWKSLAEAVEAGDVEVRKDLAWLGLALGVMTRAGEPLEVGDAMLVALASIDTSTVRLSPYRLAALTGDDLYEVSDRCEELGVESPALYRREFRGGVRRLIELDPDLAGSSSPISPSYVLRTLPLMSRGLERGLRKGVQLTASFLPFAAPDPYGVDALGSLPLNGREIAILIRERHRTGELSKESTIAQRAAVKLAAEAAFGEDRGSGVPLDAARRHLLERAFYESMPPGAFRRQFLGPALRTPTGASRISVGESPDPSHRLPSARDLAAFIKHGESLARETTPSQRKRMLLAVNAVVENMRANRSDFTVDTPWSPDVLVEARGREHLRGPDRPYESYLTQLLERWDSYVEATATTHDDAFESTQRLEDALSVHLPHRAELVALVDEALRPTWREFGVVDDLRFFTPTTALVAIRRANPALPTKALERIGRGLKGLEGRFGPANKTTALFGWCRHEESEQLHTAADAILRVAGSDASAETLVEAMARVIARPTLGDYLWLSEEELEVVFAGSPETEPARRALDSFLGLQRPPTVDTRLVDRLDSAPTVGEVIASLHDQPEVASYLSQSVRDITGSPHYLDTRLTTAVQQALRSVASGEDTTHGPDDGAPRYRAEQLSLLRRVSVVVDDMQRIRDVEGQSAGPEQLPSLMAPPAVVERRVTELGRRVETGQIELRYLQLFAAAGDVVRHADLSETSGLSAETIQEVRNKLEQEDGGLRYLFDDVLVAFDRLRDVEGPSIDDGDEQRGDAASPSPDTGPDTLPVDSGNAAEIPSETDLRGVDSEESVAEKGASEHRSSDPYDEIGLPAGLDSPRSGLTPAHFGEGVSTPTAFDGRDPSPDVDELLVGPFGRKGLECRDTLGF